MTVGFWALALMWVPAIEVGDHLFSVVPLMNTVAPRDGLALILMWLPLAVLILAPMGLPSALLCRRLWQLGYRRVAWSAGSVVFAAAAVIISSDGQVIHSLQGTIGASAFAPNVLAMTLPVWLLVHPAIVGALVWIAIVLLQRSITAHAETDRRNPFPNVRFWLLGLLWLPAETGGGILIQFLPALGATHPQEEFRFFLAPLSVVPMGEVQLWVRLLPMFAVLLLVFSPAGLMVALPCRQLWRLGYGGAAWLIGAAAALSVAARLSLAMDLFLLITPPQFVGTAGRIVETLYYAGQVLPSDIAVYLAVFNLPLLVVVVLLECRRAARDGGSGIEGNAEQL